MKPEKKKWLVILAAVLLCLVVIYLCTIVGITSIPTDKVNKILASRLFHLPMDTEGITSGMESIIWNIRLPRILLGFITGAALALCGSSYQGIFQNPMADPFILGVSSGAALGASIGIICNFSQGFLGMNGTTIMAFIGSFATIIMVYTISRVGRKVPVANLLLSGIAVSQTLAAFMSILMIFNQQSMSQIMFWTMGSLNGVGWKEILTVLPYVIVGIILLLFSSRELDVILMGEDTAVQLGVNVEFVKKKILIVSSVVTAAVVSVTGIIGFVGLLVPHVVRLFTGPKHKLLMPVSILVGGTFLILCDTLSRSLVAQEIPVGIITAACGGPFFLFLLRNSRKKGDMS